MNHRLRPPPLAICSLVSLQPASSFEAVSVPGYVPGAAADGSSRLLACYDAQGPPPLDHVSPAALPARAQRGLGLGAAPCTAHRDAILDLKALDLPSKLMLSSG